MTLKILRAFTLNTSIYNTKHRTREYYNIPFHLIGSFVCKINKFIICEICNCIYSAMIVCDTQIKSNTITNVECGDLAFDIDMTVILKLLHLTYWKVQFTFRNLVIFLKLSSNETIHQPVNRFFNFFADTRLLSLLQILKKKNFAVNLIFTTWK